MATTQDLGGTEKFLSGFNIKSYTINASNILNINGVQKASYGNTVSSISNFICNVSGTDLFNATNSCGVYGLDGTYSSAGVFPIIGSMANLDQFNADTIFDAWLVFPGYSIQLFNGAGYTGATISNILTNTYSKPVIFTSNQNSYNIFSVIVFKSGTTGTNIPADIYPTGTGSAVSIRVWFQNKEIFIKGMSDNSVYE
jgi:hypothetical protein